MSIGGDNFRGEVSLIQVWNKELNQSTVAALGSEDVTSVYLEHLLLDWSWSAYETDDGVFRYVVPFSMEFTYNKIITKFG